MNGAELLHYLVWPFMACLVLAGIHCYLGLHVVSRGVIFVDLALAQLAFLGTATAATIQHYLGTPPLSAAPETAAVPGNADGRANRTQASFPDSAEEIDQLIEAELADAPDTSPAHAEPPREHTAALNGSAWGPYLGGIAFTLVGAAVFAVCRGRTGPVPQEAIIGIVYAVGAALTVILIYKSPVDALEQTEAMLVGRILFVHPSDVLHAAVLYAAVAAVHVICWRPFSVLSFHPDREQALGRVARWWDFLFYATFGLVVSSSVQMAGVLLVFSFLVVPAVAAMLVAKSLLVRLLLGWSLGVGAALLGLALSVVLDAPTGASVVVAFAGLLLGTALFARLRR